MALWRHKFYYTSIWQHFPFLFNTDLLNIQNTWSSEADEKARGCWMSLQTLNQQFPGFSRVVCWGVPTHSAWSSQFLIKIQVMGDRDEKRDKIVSIYDHIHHLSAFLFYHNSERYTNCYLNSLLTFLFILTAPFMNIYDWWYYEVFSVVSRERAGAGHKPCKQPATVRARRELVQKSVHTTEHLCTFNRRFFLTHWEIYINNCQFTHLWLAQLKWLDLNRRYARIEYNSKF